jgi:singapore isolate B (sub-type 7) whole genome shotgun sequence assembly, scaffold_12
VENGTITPGSHLQRQKKISRTNLVKQQDLESLYRELEEEMKAVLYGKSQSASQAEQPPERAVTTMNELDQTLIEPSHEAEGESHKTEDREVVKEGVTAKEAEVQQAVAGAYDAEVEEMFLSEEEQKKKMELWEAANGDWIRQQEEKRKEKEARGAKMTKRKKKVNVGHRTWIILRIGLSIVIL